MKTRELAKDAQARLYRLSVICWRRSEIPHSELNQN
jgi:hypothetical protein